MRVDIINKSNMKSWNEYVKNSPDSTIFHTNGWRTLLEKYKNYEPVYLAAVKENCIKGVLPLFYIHHHFFGSKLVSVQTIKMPEKFFLKKPLN